MGHKVAAFSFFLPSGETREQRTLPPISQLFTLQLPGDGSQDGTEVEISFWDLHVNS